MSDKAKFSVGGLDLRTAPFSEILALEGVGPSKMERYMKMVGRWEEYQEYLKPIEIDGVQITKSDLSRYGNLVSIFRQFPGYDPEDPKWAGEFDERTSAARKAFQAARRRGEISDRDLAEKIADSKQARARNIESDAADLVQETTGVHPDVVDDVSRRIQDHYEQFLSETNASTVAEQKDVFYAATQQVTREMFAQAYVELTAKIARPGAKPTSNDLKMLQTLSEQMNRASADVEKIMKNFRKKGEGLGPSQYITETLELGKEIMATFYQDFQCPVCGVRYGQVGLFTPVDGFPVIDFDCVRTMPDGKRCTGHIHVDMNEHLKNNKVVKFTHAAHFDPSVMVKQLRRD